MVLAAKAPLSEQIDIYQELRAYWAENPVVYARDRLGMSLTYQQRAILEAIAEPGGKVSVRSGHGIGKTSCFAAAIWWFLETREFARIPCTAPTAHQLLNNLWGELGKWQRKSDSLSKQRGDHPRLWLSTLFKMTKDRVADQSAPLEWFAVARTARKESSEALQGFHATDLTISADGRELIAEGDGRILVIIDEASGVPEEVFEVLEGVLASRDARVLMAGNPTRLSGTFYLSHTRLRGFYQALHFRTMDSPLAAPQYRVNLVKKFGEGSNVVLVRADGEFPRQEEDVLIPLPLAEACLSRERPEVSGERRLGVDVARFGDDRTVLLLRHGTLVEHTAVYAKQDTMVTVGCVLEKLLQWEADGIYIDALNMGAGVVDRLKEITPHTPGLADEVKAYMLKRGWAKLPVYPVDVSGEAPPRKKGEPQGRRLRDHLWLEMATWIREEAPVFLAEHSEDLAGELATPKYSPDSSGRIVIESKDDMRNRLKRIGSSGGSPDLADALGVTFAPTRRTAPLAPLAVGQSNPWRIR